MIKSICMITALVMIPFYSISQVVEETPANTIKIGKAQVTSLAIAPKGDRILVGTDKGAVLHDLESGKKVHSFDFNEDGSTAVYYTGFNENGELVVLIGHSGKRQVWDVRSGKQEKILSEHRWIPDSRAVKAMGLDMKNSTFDRFYQQSEVTHGDVTIRAEKNGAIAFVDAEGKAVQKLEFPENSDQHHRSPLLIHEGRLFTGTDDGRVMVYTIK